MKLLDWEVGLEQPFFLICGPCVIESEQLAIDTAGFMKEITDRLGIPYISPSDAKLQISNNPANCTTVEKGE